MAARIIKLSDAERDLDELFDLIAADSGNDRAEAIFRRLSSALDSLAAFPRIGRIRDDLDGSPRVFAVWPWLIVYEPLGPTGIVVWRIIDGRRDLPRTILRPRKK
jgi:toxin ParE1/3/4